jgi:hypothetical protein
MKPPYGDIDLDVIREVAKEVRTLCYQQDRREAGSDLAKTLHNCDRFLGLMSQEIERLRAELEQAKAEPIRPMLCWTATPPTEPGHYWTRDAEPGDPVIVVIHRDDDGRLWAECCDMDDIAGWWGPIPRPSEGKGGVV